MEKRWLFMFTIMLSLVLLLGGCSKVDDAVAEDTGQSGSDSAQLPADQEDVSDVSIEDEPAAAQYSAKEGLLAAEGVVKKLYPDAVFVGVKAEMDVSGKSGSWAYSFDSARRSKGFEVTDGVLREKTFSFQAEIEIWIDSTAVAKKCGAGEATLEAGKWIVAGEEEFCELDAATGEKNED